MISKYQTRHHLSFIDGIRALAAIYIVMNHAILEYYNITASHVENVSGEQLTGVKRAFVLCFSQGHYAVNLFIVVSGFSLMLSVVKSNHVLKGGFLTFLKRRVIRILPPYYIALAFSMLLIRFLIGNTTGAHWDISIPVSYQDIVMHILLVHDFFFNSIYKINHVFWSISVEFRIYLFFPLLIWVLKKRGLTSVVFISILIATAGSVFLLSLEKYYAGVTLSVAGVSPYVVLFAFGMLAAELAFSDKANAQLIRKRYLNLSAAVATTAVAIYVAICIITKLFFKPINFYLHRVDISSKVFEIFLGIFFAFILFICAIPRRDKKILLVKLLSWRPLVFTGTFSYSLYLIHAPLLVLISRYILASVNLTSFIKSMLLFSVGTLAIIIVSYFFFYLFERPFLALGKRIKVKPE